MDPPFLLLQLSSCGRNYNNGYYCPLALSLHVLLLRKQKRTTWLEFCEEEELSQHLLLWGSVSPSCINYIEVSNMGKDCLLFSGCW